MNVMVKFLDLCLISWTKIIFLEVQTKGIPVIIQGLKLSRNLGICCRKLIALNVFWEPHTLEKAKANVMGEEVFKSLIQKLFC